MPSIESLPASPILQPGKVHPRDLDNSSPLAQSALLCVQLLPTGCLVAAGLPLKQRAGAVDKYLPWDAWRLFLNGPDSSTFDDHCNASFTQLFVAANSCTNGGETGRTGPL